MLVGFDKSPLSSTPGDSSWKKRSMDWNISSIYKEKYDSNEVTVDIIVDLVEQRGGWSIWFTVFNGYDDVREALIEDFKRTAKDCFDASNHYEPINRNPQNIDDPV